MRSQAWIRLFSIYHQIDGVSMGISVNLVEIDNDYKLKPGIKNYLGYTRFTFPLFLFSHNGPYFGKLSTGSLWICIYFSWSTHSFAFNLRHLHLQSTLVVRSHLSALSGFSSGAVRFIHQFRSWVPTASSLRKPDPTLRNKVVPACVQWTQVWIKLNNNRVKS